MRKNKKMQKRKINTLPYHLMLLPGTVCLFIFSIVPMMGIIIAFQDFVPTMGIRGSEWVGFDNFKYMFQLPDTILTVSYTHLDVYKRQEWMYLWKWAPKEKTNPPSMKAISI